MVFTLVINILGMMPSIKAVSADSRPKVTNVELADQSLSVGTYPTLKISSAGCESVQYNVYLYSPTTKKWENVSGGYTSAVKGNSTYTLKLKGPVHEGENSFSVWVKKAGASPIDKGGYDDFQSYRVNVGSTKIPKITTAEIPKSQQVLGQKNPTLAVSSDGEGDVQYRVYLYSPTKKVWEDVTGGYTQSYSANTKVSLMLNTELHSGENSFSVWVKRAGQNPIDKGGYDTFLSYKINVGSDGGTNPTEPTNGLPKIQSASINSSELKAGLLPTINISATGSEQVQYRVYLYSPTKKVWEDVGGGYTSAQNPSNVYALKSNIPLHEGENSFSVWVKRAGKDPVDKGGYDNFLSYKVNVTEKVNTTPKITSVNYDSSEVAVGSQPTLKLKSDSGVNVEYKVFLYSQTKGVWDDVSNGYTTSSDPNIEKSIKITKPLQPGRNTFSIYVKKAGYAADNPAGYDTYVHEVINVNQDSSKIATITSTTVDESKKVVGDKPEITVAGKSGDGSSINYKAFFYSNSQKKWLDATSYTSGIASGSSTKLSLNSALEEGSNKVLIWAKRSSLNGEVYESFKEVTIDAIKPAPLKKKIVVDPGHGGKDPGAVSSGGTRERDINLIVGLKLGELLKSGGYNVLYTRTSNDSVAWDSSNQNASLKYRSNFANTNGADIFVSVHCNSGGGTGSETWYSKTNPNKDKALATSIQNEFIKATGMKNRGIKNSQNLHVVNNTNMAASLVELGFVDTPSDERQLNDPTFQKNAAQGIYNGVVNYK